MQVFKYKSSLIKKNADNIFKLSLEKWAICV